MNNLYFLVEIDGEYVEFPVLRCPFHTYQGHCKHGPWQCQYPFEVPEKCPLTGKELKVKMGRSA